MPLSGFHHLAIQSRDPIALASFYREVLGLQELDRHLTREGKLRSIWLSLPGSGFLALERTDGEPAPEEFRRSRPGYSLFALRIAPEDRSALLKELARKGVQIVHQTRWTIYIRDPEGNRIGLSHHPEDAVE